MLLAHISQQLGSYGVNSVFLNSTQPPITLAQATGAATPPLDAPYYIGLAAACCAFMAFICSLAVVWLCITSFLLWASIGDQRSQQRWYTRSHPYHSIAWPFIPAFRDFFNLSIPLVTLVSVLFLAVSLHLFMIGLAIQCFQEKAAFTIILICAVSSAILCVWMVYRVIMANAYTILMREMDYTERNIGWHIGHMFWKVTRKRYRYWNAIGSFRDANKAAILLAAFFGAKGEKLLRTSGRLFLRELPTWLMFEVTRHAWMRCLKDLKDYHVPSISPRLPLALHYLHLEVLEAIEVSGQTVQPSPAAGTATKHLSPAAPTFSPLSVLLGGSSPEIGAPPLFSGLLDLSSYSSETHETEPAMHAKDVVGMLWRMLQIGPVWPENEQIDSLFFPLMAAYAKRGYIYGSLAMAILQLSLELPQFEQHGFPSGSVEGQ